MIKVHQKQAVKGSQPWTPVAPENKIFNSEWDGDFRRYARVANINSNELDDAFLFTNHPEREAMGYMDAVEQFKAMRSVSVSDILEMDGKFYYVAPVGFVEISIH